jgi:succinyl-diaminopimelate desuccinylase
MTALHDRLAQRTLELVDIPSESRHEDAIRAHIRTLVPGSLTLDFAGEDVFLWMTERRAVVPLVLLVGHYDTIPAQGNLPGRIEDGAVHGCGATDMKGGLAVALEVLRDLTARPVGSPLDVGLLLFGKEELPIQFSPLPELFAQSKSVHEASLAILLEPTDLTIQAGCVGNMNVRVRFHGVSGHSARPWLADNAISKAIAGLASLAALPPRDAVIGGLTFREVATLTRLEAGIADNVVPDLAVATLNVRYPPDRTSAEAEAWIRSLLPEDADVEIESDNPPGRVVVDTELVLALRDAGNLAIEPKQAWTNVADFTAQGIDAVNFGPGATRYAHRRDERVEIDALVQAYEILMRFLTGS